MSGAPYSLYVLHYPELERVCPAGAQISVEFDPGFRMGGVDYYLKFGGGETISHGTIATNEIQFRLEKPAISPSRAVAANPATPVNQLIKERDGVYRLGLLPYEGRELEYLNFTLQCGGREPLTLRFSNGQPSIPPKFLLFLIVLEDPAQPSGLRVVPRASTD
jgi:hypothetical protein